MYSEKGIVLGWDTPDMEDGFGLMAGQIDGTERLDLNFGRKDTKFNNLHELEFGA